MHVSPGERYAGDVECERDAGLDEDAATDNSKYFAWDQAIHGVADGTVYAADDQYPDHAAFMTSPPHHAAAADQPRLRPARSPPIHRRRTPPSRGARRG
jgi:hypothetical protein